MSRVLGFLFLSMVVLAPLTASATQPGSFDPAQAVETYLGQITGEARERSDAYFEGNYKLDAVDAAIGVGLALALLFSGIARRLRDWAASWSSLVFIQTILFTFAFSLITAILTFPMTYWRDFVREHAFGLSNQTVSAWASEYATGLGIGLVMTSIFAALIFAVVRRTAQWWAYGALLSIVFMAVTVAAAPVFLAPIFNTYKPMDESPLKAQILAMARANGIPADNVYQFDASRQTKRISANVSGLFGTTRISLNDNLLNRTSPEEIRAVMGHEMGHYALNHIYKYLAFMAIVLSVAFFLIGLLHRGLIAVFGPAWGVEGRGDLAGLPALFAAATFVFYLLTPVFNGLTRMQEIEADIYGLNAARDPDGFARVALKLSEYRKLDPTWWEEALFYTHPSGRARITMAMRWKAEHLDPTYTAQWPHALSYQQDRSVQWPMAAGAVSPAPR